MLGVELRSQIDYFNLYHTGHPFWFTKQICPMLEGGLVRLGTIGSTTQLQTPACALSSATNCPAIANTGCATKKRNMKYSSFSHWWLWIMPSSGI
jgi:hypothetical protein